MSRRTARIPYSLLPLCAMLLPLLSCSDNGSGGGPTGPGGGNAPMVQSIGTVSDAARLLAEDSALVYPACNSGLLINCPHRVPGNTVRLHSTIAGLLVDSVADAPGQFFYQLTLVVTTPAAISITIPHVGVCQMIIDTHTGDDSTITLSRTVGFVGLGNSEAGNRMDFNTPVVSGVRDDMIHLTGFSGCETAIPSSMALDVLQSAFERPFDLCGGKDGVEFARCPGEGE